jgi:hypothetical protein
MSQLQITGNHQPTSHRLKKHSLIALFTLVVPMRWHFWRSILAQLAYFQRGMQQTGISSLTVCIFYAAQQALSETSLRHVCRKYASCL